MIEINVKKISSAKVIIFANKFSILAVSNIMKWIKKTYKVLSSPSASVITSPAYTPTNVCAGIRLVPANIPKKALSQVTILHNNLFTPSFFFCLLDINFNLPSMLNYLKCNNSIRIVFDRKKLLLPTRLIHSSPHPHNTLHSKIG